MTTAQVEHQLIRAKDLSREQNYEHWRAGVSSLFEAVPATDDLDGFSADLESYNLGRFLIGKSSASAQRFHRSNELVAASGVDHLLIQLYLKGECAYNADGGIAKGGAGDIVCFDLSRPMRSQTTDMDILSLILPRAMIRLMPDAIDDVHGARVDGNSTLGVLLGEHMMSLARVAPRLDAADGLLAAEAASILVSAGLSSAVAAERSALTDTNLQTIQVYIERNLSNPGLSTEMIMRQFGLSRSSLYRLFEPLGGVAEYIRERRLKLAQLKLASVGNAHGAVAKLAYITGFPSKTAFSRAFQQYYGIRPSEAIRDAEARIHLNGRLGADRNNWMQAWLDRLHVRT
ncbi:helix-turn-helix domain-containing protein [Breoghania sp. JC706]|uniref:AraC-like ligand-binding domain-containing protein n=1 Tax=Breoghania sp. JC706 TaxID=3117732 RepID=UPI0030092FAA